MHKFFEKNSHLCQFESESVIKRTFDENKVDTSLKNCFLFAKNPEKTSTKSSQVKK